MPRPRACALAALLLAATPALAQQTPTPLFRHIDPATGAYGYVDEQLQWVIKPRFTRAFNFKGPFAIVALGQGGNIRWGTIDRAGKEILPIEYAMAPHFSEGLAAVKRTGANARYQFVDTTGKPAFPDTFHVADSFSDGLAEVRPESEGANFYIDKTGKRAVTPPFRGILTRFGNGTARVSLATMENVLFNKGGKEVARINGGYVGAFSEGLAPFYPPTRVGNYTYGFLDTTGKTVIAPKWDHAFPFSQERAAVRQFGLWGFIDKAGKEVIPLQFQEAASFENGTAKVRIDGLWGLIDKNGRWILEPRYTDLDEPVGDRVLVNRPDPSVKPAPRVVKLGATHDVNPGKHIVPQGLIALITQDDRRMPATFAGVERLSESQKTQLQDAFTLMDSGSAERGVAALEKLHKEGVVAASQVLGRCFQTGQGVPADAIRARRFYEDAARAGEPYCAFQLATMHYAGEGGPRDILRAFDLMRLAYSENHVPAFRHMALFFLDGRLVDVAPATAVQLLYEGAKKGDVTAGLATAFCLERGIGTAPNAKDALAMYKAAADAGDIEGALHTARLLEAAADPTGALTYYEKAAPHSKDAQERATTLRAATRPAGE